MFGVYYRPLMGMRDTMREAFVQATLRGEHPTGWRLRIGSIEQLSEDTQHVLGYKPRQPTSFLGLPVEVCPYGEPNELVTSAGSIMLPSAPILNAGNVTDLGDLDRCGRGRNNVMNRIAAKQ